MIKNIIYKCKPAIIAGLILCSFSCKKNQELGINNMGDFSDTTGTLKSLVSFPIGLAIEKGLSTSNSGYFATVKREANIVTFGNEMKHSYIVQNDGSLNFANTDAFVTLCTNAGLNIYGHTLVWHSQQNTNYLNTLVTGSGGSNAVNLVPNGDFEAGPDAVTGDLFTNWQDLNHSNGTFSVATGVAAHGGNRALQTTTVAGGNNYNTQIITRTPIPVTAGKVYTVSYWIKGNAAGSIQFEIRSSDGSVNYQGGKAVGTSWTQISYSYTATGTTMQIAFDLGGNANTFYIDDVSVVDALAAAPPTGAQVLANVDNAMKTYIQGMMTHYAGKVKQWDVLNEPFTDGGDLRNNSNTPATTSGIFVWQNYLGRDYAKKAFGYAKAIDANADLFMNEYNLETNTTKLNAFIALAKELKDANAGITGLGTQMHINIGTPKAGIDAAFKALAATGLKVRVSELDVRANPGENSSFVLTPFTSADQAVMYKYVVWSYLQNVPPAQRAGITVWGVDDPSSWIVTSLKKVDQPDLFDKNFGKKQAYVGFKQGLQGKTP
ncbi:hypothetical protein DBR11_07890 [Pedobacter sp. HMWF019]|uniref:endo-1,4-beta-xylanase n=1 Tax=Pedobacter sp. HMWF019 TaxID=2056856 RepID=UPI000D3B45B7|nr:endo-1,4-beta-xylanase [Pedobacter sp. HMWF019]PTT01241.1 hypothetical protein DBR11_07890 [Pedobacter sp. HMWF019]